MSPVLSRWWIVPILTWTLASTARNTVSEKHPVASDTGLCYAFMHQGDLWTVCQGKREQIFLDGKAADFAVSADASLLVVVLEKGHVLAEDQGGAQVDELKVVRLNGTAQAAVKRWPYGAPHGPIYASCGTVLGVDWALDSSRQHAFPVTYDLILGKELRPAPYKYVRCSTDRKVFAGWDQPGVPALLVSSLLEYKVPAALDGKKLLQEFDVSPSGRYVAYFRPGSSNSNQLCVAEAGKSPSCISATLAPERISVSDSGDVIFMSDSEKECFFKDPEHYSTTPQPGYLERDACPQISAWNPGDKQPTLLEDLGRHPQWITAEAAKALHEWNSRMTRGSKNHR